MEEQNQQKQENIKKVSKKLKIVAIIAGAVIVFLVAAFYGFSWYGEWSLRRDIGRMIKEANLPYLEDIYGGKTPKETLELFIAAVEKDDFALASKYLVLSKQSEWEKGLKKVKEKGNFDWFLAELKRVDNTLDYADPTAQLGSRQFYTVGDKMLITFIKYPSGIWKIQEF